MKMLHQVHEPGTVPSASVRSASLLLVDFHRILRTRALAVAVTDEDTNTPRKCLV